MLKQWKITSRVELLYLRSHFKLILKSDSNPNLHCIALDYRVNSVFLVTCIGHTNLSILEGDSYDIEVSAFNHPNSMILTAFIFAISVKQS